MSSHEYQFGLRDLLRYLSGPAAGLIMFVVTMHVGARIDLLPAPRPALNTEQTILIHKTDAAANSNSAELILVGDSSCLMDVEANLLGKELGKQVLNLGTFSFLGIEDHAELASNSRQAKVIVLLLHPRTLKRTGGDEYYSDFVRAYKEEEDFCWGETFEERLPCLLGVNIFQGRIGARVLPVPLSGAFGHEYGFARHLEETLERQNGSLEDPVFEEAQGKEEFFLNETVQGDCEYFRRKLGKGVKIVAGITPVPASLAQENYRQLHKEMLEKLGQWLNTSHLLTNLPAVLPDASFMRPTHLNSAAMQGYTKQLAEALQ